MVLTAAESLPCFFYSQFKQTTNIFCEGFTVKTCASGGRQICPPADKRPVAVPLYLFNVPCAACGAIRKFHSMPVLPNYDTGIDETALMSFKLNLLSSVL